MLTLTLSDFGSKMDSLLPKVNKTNNILLALALRNPVFKYIIFKRTKAILLRITKKFDIALQDLKTNDLGLDKPEDFRDKIQNHIYQFSDLRTKLKGLDYYTETQEKILKDLVNSVIRKMMKLEAISIKQINKDKPKVNDSELIQLVMNNNSIELQKNIKTQ